VFYFSFISRSAKSEIKLQFTQCCRWSADTKQNFVLFQAFAHRETEIKHEALFTIIYGNNLNRQKYKQKIKLN